MAKNKSEEIRLNRAARKGREAGRKAHMKSAEAYKALLACNPYTESARASAWKAAFEANGQPKPEETANA